MSKELCGTGYHIINKVSGYCKCGMVSPAKPKLTPPEAIEALERRFELGKVNYPLECWNDTTTQEKLDDKQWIRERIEHARIHTQHFWEVMYGLTKDDGDDDGAAIMWLGCMLHMAYERRKKQKS